MTKRSVNLADLKMIPKTEIPSMGNHIFNTPRKCVYCINYMCYQYSSACVGAYCAIFTQNY